MSVAQICVFLLSFVVSIAISLWVFTKAVKTKRLPIRLSLLLTSVAVLGIGEVVSIYIASLI